MTVPNDLGLDLQHGEVIRAALETATLALQSFAVPLDEGLTLSIDLAVQLLDCVETRCAGHDAASHDVNPMGKLDELRVGA